MLMNTNPQTKKAPRGAPFTARPRLISNADFKNLCQLAFFDRASNDHFHELIATACNISPRNAQRWISKDEEIPAPIDAIEKILEIATHKHGAASNWLNTIAQSITKANQS